MLNRKQMINNVEIITQADTDIIAVLINKSISEIMFYLDLSEEDIEPKHIPEISSLCEDLAMFKYNTLEKQGIKAEKFDVISTEYADIALPSSISNRINRLAQKLNQNTFTGYATISSPFID